MLNPFVVPQPDPTPHPAPPLFGYGLALAVVIVVGLRGLQLPGYLPRDPGAFCMQAALVAEGKLPYLDFWEHKNPGMMLMLGVVFKFTGNSHLAARAAEALLVLASCAALAAIERRWYGPRALGLSAPILALFWSLPQMTDGGLYTGFWSGAFQVLSVAAFSYAAKPQRHGWRGLAAAAGIACFCAFACRQTGLAIVALLFALAMEEGARRGCQLLLWAGATFLACCLAGAAWLWANGLWELYVRDAYRFNALKNQWLAQIDPHADRIWNMIRGWIETLRWSLLLPALGLLAGMLRRSERRITHLLLAWIAMTGLGAAASRAGYSHYILEMLPPLALATAAVCTAGLRPLWAVHSRYAFVLLPVCMLAIGLSVRWSASDRAYLVHGWRWWTGRASVDGRENLLHLAAARLREITQPGEIVHIWSALPGIQFLSGTRPATRYPQNLPLLEASVTEPQELDRVLSQLQATLPRYCMIVQEGLQEFASRGDAPWPRQQEWIDANYHPFGPPLSAPPNAEGRYNTAIIQLHERNKAAAP